MANRIEMHGQIKAFYSIIFNNTFDIRTSHVSLYIFLLNQNNRNNWVEWFKCPYDLAMQGACINSRTTYYSILSDLQNYKLIEYKKGINNFKAPMIKIIPITIPKNEQLTEHVTVPQSEQQYAQQPVQLPVHINKLITDNLKLIEANFSKFEKYVLKLDKEKPPKPIEPEPEWKKDFEIYKQNCRDGFEEIKKDKDWIELQESYYYNIDIIKSVEKNFVNFWSTKNGWENKKKSGSIELNWKTTMGNSLKYKENQVYKQNKN